MFLKILAMTSLLIALNACHKKDGGDGGGTTSTQSDSSVPDPSFVLRAAGVKNFRALYASMGAVTGVMPTGTVQQIYDANVTRLSLNGDATAISASGLLATGLLAAAHCDQAIKNHVAGQASPMFAAINFNQTEKQLTPAVRQSLITDVVHVAWPGREPTAADISDFSGAIDGVVAGGPANSKNTLRAAALVVCSGALGSLPFYRN